MKKLFTIFATFALLCAVGCEEQGDDNVNPNDKPNTEQPGEKPDDGSEIPDDAYIIEYTSADGYTITPYDSSAFDATIIRNEYIDGNGYIEFDAPITSIGEGAFFECTSLISITIPDSVTWIGEWAFEDCDSLTSIIIPDSVTSIGEGAFAGCESLASVTIPDSVTSIEERAFCYCSSLTSITIPDSVTWIGEWAFRSCTSLKSFYGKYASDDGRCLIIDGTINSFAPAGLTKYTIPDGVTSIGDSAFEGCSSLTSIIIPDSVTSIGEEAFFECSSLTSITIPDSVTWIGEQAFFGCFSLKSVTIGDGVTSIGYGAFYNCTSLKSVTIGDGVTKIEGDAFRNCSSLTSVYCKATTPPAGDWYMFDNNDSGRKIYVPRASVNAYKAASYWSEYKSSIYGYDF